MGSEGHGDTIADVDEIDNTGPTGDQSDDVIARLFGAIVSYDAVTIRGLTTPGFRRWLSLTEQETDRDELVATVERERSVVSGAEFTLRRRVDTADGAVLMLAVDGTTAPGAAFHIPVCLVVTMEGELVSRIDEYANLEKARALLKEMSAP